MSRSWFSALQWGVKNLKILQDYTFIIPKHPWDWMGLVYLIKIHLNVGKYTIHGLYGNAIIVNYRYHMIYIYVFQLDIGLSPNQAGVKTKQTNNRTLEHRLTKPCPKRECGKKNIKTLQAKWQSIAELLQSVSEGSNRLTCGFFSLHEFLWPKYWLLDINNIPTARKKET